MDAVRSVRWGRSPAPCSRWAGSTGAACEGASEVTTGTRQQPETNTWGEPLVPGPQLALRFAYRRSESPSMRKHLPSSARKRASSACGFRLAASGHGAAARDAADLRGRRRRGAGRAPGVIAVVGIEQIRRVVDSQLQPAPARIQRPRSGRVVRLLLIRHGETALNAARILQPRHPSERTRPRRPPHWRAPPGRRADRGALVQRPAARAWQTAVAIASGRAIRPSRCCRSATSATGAGSPTTASLSIRWPPSKRRRAANRRRPSTNASRGPGRSPEAAAAELPGAGAGHARAGDPAPVRNRHRPAGGGPLPARIGNTSLTVVEGRPPRASLVDCTAHLDAARADDPRALSGG